MHGVGCVREAQRVSDVGDRQQREGAGRHHPPRYVPNQSATTVLNALPSQRQFRRGGAALIANLSVEIALKFSELCLPSFLHSVFTSEAERQTEVQQLHQVDETLRVARNTVQHVEKLLAAPRLVMQRHEQRLLRPLALRT